MTHTGTNTYMIGDADRAIIDPGPDDPTHLEAILNAIGTAPLVAILVTHSHVDHSPLARALSDTTGAKIHAFGQSDAGRAPHMTTLAQSGLVGGGEGIDAAFAPDIHLKDGQSVSGADWALTAIWTPGHLSNHLCFALSSAAASDALFTGDHVMGWASSLVSPPDGDLTAFMASCERLSERDDRIYYPGHGDPVTDPKSRINWLISHRKKREDQIIEALQAGPATAASLTQAVYTDVAPALLPAAERNVLAHLIDLFQRGMITSDDLLSSTSQFRLTGPR